MTELDVARHSRLVDPQLHVWGWEVPVYLFLGGMAAGLMIVGAVLALRRPERSASVRWLAFAAPVLVSLGMGALFLDLAYKIHVWRFYLAFRWTSPMSWGAWILAVVYPVTVLAAVAGLSDAQWERLRGIAERLGLSRTADAARELGLRHARRLFWAQLAVGSALGVYTGVLLSTLGARALWSSALLGPLFLVSGVSTGIAFLMVFRIGEEERALLARWDQGAIALELAVLALFLVGLGTGGEQARHAARLLLGGPYTADFWSLVVIAGLAVPLVLATLERRLHLRLTLVAPALVLAGGLALRFIVVAAGQAT